MKLDQFRDAILGAGLTFKNVEEFRYTIYHMSLGGRFKYKYMKKSPKHMSMKCSIDNFLWMITAHVVTENETLRVDMFRVNNNHIEINVHLR